MSAPSRRDFLRLGVTAGGALLLEIALPGCGGPPRAVAAANGGVAFVPNAWLRIEPDDRIIFVLDRVEMGQGTMTGQAQLVAEELAIDPSRLVVELAPANRAYDNPDAGLGFQATGGSTSTRASFIPLRTAAATAREALRQAAARKWGVALATCTAENGAIVHAASGRRARYGELAADAAREDVDAPALKPAKDFRVIGKAVPRLDIRAKVDGSAVYGIDVKVPGLAVAVVLRAPVLGAKLLGFDAAEAKAQPGVVDVIAIPTGVAVVAETYWRARRAAQAVRVRWSEGETHLDTERLRSAYRARLESSGVAQRNDGSFASAERRAARVVDALYEVPYLAHATLEPQNATAVVKDGRCEVWAPTQAPGLAREAVRSVTGFAYDDIVVHQTLLGGGFGRRLAQDYVVEAVHVALRVHRPVKVIWSREDDTRHDVYRPMAMTRVRAAIGRNGALDGWFQRIVSQSIAANVGPEWVHAFLPNRVPLSLKASMGRSAAITFGGGALFDETTAEGARDLAYGIPNVRVEHAVMAAEVPVGFWRSVGFSHNVFVTESFFDEVAHAMGRDPFELRRSLLAKAPRHRRVLELAAEKVGWGTPAKPGVFRGIAQARSFESYAAHVAEVSVHGAEVKVHRVVAAVDCGTVVNPDIVRAQVEGGIAFGLGAALRQEITLDAGRVTQGNFDDFEPLRIHEMPEVEVHVVPSDEPPTGIGEPGLPPIAPAVANAIFHATNRRVRRMPFSRAFAEDAAATVKGRTP